MNIVDIVVYFQGTSCLNEDVTIIKSILNRKTKKMNEPTFNNV